MATETTRLLNGNSTIINGLPSEKSKIEGLSLEELMRYETDPWWQNLRKTFFLSFWFTLIVIFVAACITSILQHDKCPVKTIGRNGASVLMYSEALNAGKSILMASFNGSVVDNN